MPIKKVEVRAIVKVCSLKVSTPYVQSFSVRKQRGQVSTFDASLKVEYTSFATSSLTGGNVSVSAGVNGSLDLIFTGVVKQAKISPCFDDPKYVILSISGSDKLSLLNGKKYTRRCRSTKAAWVAITGVSRRGLKSEKFAYQNEPHIEMDGGTLFKENPVTATKGDNFSEIKTIKAPNKQSHTAPQPTVTIVGGD